MNGFRCLMIAMSLAACVRAADLPPGAERRFGTTAWRMESGSEVLAPSPDGKMVASGGAGGLIRLFDAATGAAIREWRQGDDHICALAFADAKTLAACAMSVSYLTEHSSWKYSDMVFWDVATGREIGRMKDDGSKADRDSPYNGFDNVAFARGGKHFAVNYGQRVGLFRYPEKTEVNLPLPSMEGGFAFSPDGRKFAYSGRKVVLVDLAAGSFRETDPGAVGKNGLAWDFGKEPIVGRREQLDLKDFQGPERPLVAISSRGQLAVRTTDNTRFPPPDSGGERGAWLGGLDGKKTGFAPCGDTAAIAFSPDGTILYSVSGTAIRRWSVPTGKSLDADDAHLRAVTSVAVSRDGGRVFSGSSDGTLRAWDLATGKLVGVLRPEGRILDVVDMTRDRVAVHVWKDQRRAVEIWDFGAAEAAARYDGNAFALSQDRKSLALESWVSQDDGVVDVVDLATGQKRSKLEHETPFRSLAFSPDSNRIVGCAIVPANKLPMPSDRYGHVWNTADGKSTRLLVPETCDVHYATDGKRLIVVEREKLPQPYGGAPRRDVVDLKIRAWDIATDKEIWVVDAPGARGYRRARLGIERMAQSTWLAVAPDGKTFAMSCLAGIQIRDIATGGEVGRFPGAGHGPVAFTPDGKRLVSGGDDGNLMLWKLPAPPPPADNGGKP